MSGWDDPENARCYAEFDLRHGRYRKANAALARHAALVPGLRVLDVAAGIGGTTAALLPALGHEATVDLIEPAAAMRAGGAARLGGIGGIRSVSNVPGTPGLRGPAGLRWIAGLNEAGNAYDRIVCGAAIWQWDDFGGLIAELAGRLVPGGALVFDVPAAYLGLPDPPGGGSDPWLAGFLSQVFELCPAAARTLAGADGKPRIRGDSVAIGGANPVLDRAAIVRALAAAGLVGRCWRHTQRIDVATLRDWLKIPVLSDPIWPHLAPAQRNAVLDEAARRTGNDSWRTERWLGWTAWKPPFPLGELADDCDDHSDGHTDDHSDGHRDVVVARRALSAAAVAALARRVGAAAHELRLIDGRGRWAASPLATGPDPDPGARIPGWIELQRIVLASPEFAAVAADPGLHAALERAAGGPLRGDFGNVCRVAPPQHLVAATPPHRDADYIGRADGWIAWLPLRRCGPHNGVLAVARGSQQAGVEPTQWQATTLDPGDALLFSASTWHRACPNFSARPRLSVDLRFAPPCTLHGSPGTAAAGWPDVAGAAGAPDVAAAAGAAGGAGRGAFPPSL